MNRDRGSASVLLLAIGSAVVAVGIGATLVGAAITDRHRAQVAADLGALAGARNAVDGAGIACERAGEIVAANGAGLVGCRVDGLDLVVTAQVGRARASARAGPASSASGSTRRGRDVAGLDM
jgi:secretion/DNA translocation related TadE-like protein